VSLRYVAELTVLMTFMEAAEVSSVDVSSHVARTKAAAKVAAAKTASASYCYLGDVPCCRLSGIVVASCRLRDFNDALPLRLLD
jgi:hypothetical protein